MSIDFGTDIACSPTTEDADDLFTQISGVRLVAQDVRHRLLTDSVVGPDGADWGFDLRHLLGGDASSLTAQQPRVSAVVLKDERVDSVTVLITSQILSGLTTVTVDVRAQTAIGPFRLIFVLSSQSTTVAVETIVEQ